MKYDKKRIDELGGSANGCGPISPEIIQDFLDTAQANDIAYFLHESE
jgi:hypothetical protein